MTSFQNKLILITGGASGIGKIMARRMLEKKAKVILWDIDQQKLDATISELKIQGNIVGYKVDISSPDLVQETAKRVRQECGSVDVLINNAGIIVGKYFHEHSNSDILKTMEINAHAPMFITREFLEDMLQKNSGHICNISSSGGLIGNPKMSVYVASKWALIGWSESLRLEMNRLKKKVHVTTIMPYYINTGMFDGIQSRISILEPEAAAQTIIRAIEKNKKMVTLPGYIYRLTRFGQAVMSIHLFDWFAGDLLGIYKTMEHFTGRKK